MIHFGDCREVMRRLIAEGVKAQMCVTSPPYWGLRSYGIGAENGEIGMEKTPDLYVANMVEVFRLVRDVLADDGVLWLNLGDSYNAAGRNGHGRREGFKQGTNRASANGDDENRPSVASLKPKDLIGIPWRVAFALQADGWYLRSDIIWQKPNPMPESVRDRPTRSHEYIFLFAKGQSRTRTICFSDIKPERFHLGLNLGKQCAAAGDTTRLCVSLATAFFHAAQTQKNFSLPPFYSEKWKQGANGDDGNFVARLPAIHRMATYAARFLNADATTKEFLCEMHSLWRDLRECDHLLISRALAECSDPPSVLIDGNTAIAINHSGKPRKVEFLHNRIIDTVSTTCNYFYDADAISEPSAPESLARANRNSFPNEARAAACVQGPSFRDRGEGTIKMAETRNKRDVWTVATAPYAGAHFATFPPALIEPCILAGSRPGDTVLDPFFGSGTTGQVAQHLGREWIGIELNQKYGDLQKQRIAQTGMAL